MVVCCLCIDLSDFGSKSSAPLFSFVNGGGGGGGSARGLGSRARLVVYRTVPLWGKLGKFFVPVEGTLHSQSPSPERDGKPDAESKCQREEDRRETMTTMTSGSTTLTTLPTCHKALDLLPQTKP